MAFFGLKKKKTGGKKIVKKTDVRGESDGVKENNESQSPMKKPEAAASPQFKNDLSRVLLRPRITEKATAAAESGAYAFEVDLRATKKDIARAVERYYGVKPVKVSVVPIPSKKIFSRVRGKRGRKARGKKAYVYLSKGEKIEIV